MWPKDVDESFIGAQNIYDDKNNKFAALSVKDQEPEDLPKELNGVDTSRPGRSPAP